MLATQARNVGTNCLEKRCCIIDNCVFIEDHAKNCIPKKSMNNNSNDFLFVTPKHLGALKEGHIGDLRCCGVGHFFMRCCGE